MKKNLLFTAFFMLVVGSIALAQQDTIIGFTFIDENDTEFNANFGVAENQSYDIRTESSSSQAVGSLYYTVGYEDNAAAADNWDNGMDDKYWSIKFKADSYTDLTISSMQSSGETLSGPKDWKLQAKISGGDWEDIPNGTLTVANDWTTGIVSNLSLTDAYDNMGSTSIYIRWIMTSNTSSSDSDVQSNGISKIDNIIIRGTSNTGVESELFVQSTNLYPNPCKDNLHIESLNEITKVEFYNLQGAVISESFDNTFSTTISTNRLSDGVYFVRVYFNGQNPLTTKIIVE